MIEIKNVSFTYNNTEEKALHDISLHIPVGQCVLLCGESGCGKTTVTRLLNGLIPYYYEGNLEGEITVAGMNVKDTELHQISRRVGSVFQNPRSQFFCVDTTSEIAFGCENLGLPEEVIRKRITQSAKELKIESLLDRDIFRLSGGEKQKVACASVSAMCPDIYVLDEPTSNLDMEAIEDLKNILLTWKQQGKTIVIAEHRLYWLKEICDRVLYFRNGEIAWDGNMQEFVACPEEKRLHMGLRKINKEPIAFDAQSVADYEEAMTKHREWMETDKELVLEHYRYCYKKEPALDMQSLAIPIGSVVAVIGHNGAGKSTFTRCLCGLQKGFKGKTFMDDGVYKSKEMLKKAYLVMQDVNHQLFCETVEEEVKLGIPEERLEEYEHRVEKLLTKLGLQGLEERHPLSLSGGQKQRVAVASAILADKKILVFDEPTSGLDNKRMEQTADVIRSIGGDTTILIVTHDPDLIVRCCTHVLHLEQGKIEDFYPLSTGNEKKFCDFFHTLYRE